MNEVDTILSQAFQESQVLGALLGTLLDGGRIVLLGDVSENQFNMFPGLLFFERRSPQDFQDFRQLTERDLLFVENLSVDQIWHLSQVSGAQLVLISDRATDSTLVDYQAQEKDLRSALLSLGPIWEKLQPLREGFSPDGPRNQKGLFLDRDGVVVKDVEYLHDPAQVELNPGVIKTLKKARELDFRLLVVTNQSGLGRGMYTWDQYDQVTLRLQELLAQEGLFVDRILKSPFYEKSLLASGLVRKSLRKPRPGMIHSLAREFRLDLSQSILVGDCATDLMAGALAGVGRVHLLKSHRTTDELKKWRDWPLLSRARVNLKEIEIASLEDLFKK